MNNPMKWVLLSHFTNEEWKLRADIASKRQDEILNPGLVKKHIFNYYKIHLTDILFHVFTTV